MEPLNEDKIAQLITKWSTRDSNETTPHGTDIFSGGTFPLLDAFMLGVWEDPSGHLEPTCRLSPAGITDHDNVGDCSPTGTTPAETVVIGEWHHYAMTYNSDLPCSPGVPSSHNNILYLDGVPVFSRCMAGVLEGDAALEVGMEQSGDARPWNGPIDDARIYSHALTAGEILAQFNAGVHGQTVTWTGAVDTDWSTPGNWDLRVPLEGDTVIIPTGVPNDPTLDVDFDIFDGTFTVASPLTVSGATLLVGDEATLEVDGTTLTINSDANLDFEDNGDLDLINGGSVSNAGNVDHASDIPETINVYK